MSLLGPKDGKGLRFGIDRDAAKRGVNASFFVEGHWSDGNHSV